MNRILLFLSPLFLFLAASCGQPPVEQAANSITAESLMSHIEVISSDEFEGRAPATEGEDLTVDYLVETMEQMGVEPGMDDGSYVQQIPLLGQQIDGSSAAMNIRSNGQVAEQLGYRTDFMAWPSNEAERVQLRNAELLYVGYGIQAPEFDWDDYKGADVEGKVLVFKNSDPSNDPEIFEGDSRLYYGRWSYKFEKAEEMGALGAIIIHTTPTAGYGWSVIENSWGRERFSLKGDDDAGTKPEFNGWLTEEHSENLFDLAGLNLEEMLEAAENRNFEPMPLEGVTLDLTLNATYSDMSTRNVLGQIRGSDPDLMDEYVVFTAHYDHLGVTTPVDGDSINNGALDNAAGISAVLEMANAYKQLEPEMRRSALFLFVGAEEMGLLGSLYWSQNPTIHPGKITANINMDGMQVYGETEDVVLVGYGRNTITDVIRQYADQEGRVVKPDPNPGQGFFYRSDHFSLARVGIPAIFPNPGRDYVNKPEDFIETVDSLSAVNYHSVGDEINEYWDLSGMEKDVRLFFRSSFHILNADEMMSWEEGDEFQAIREEMLMQAP
ncbi:M28 family peptidase [Rhodohalobacter sp.]|uniref:M28 family peptidase n=1 Tax=Rhodohalobacter sp. TaxID=1974210 RepID=UPI002ACD7DD8|nr:M28 family peptidase [Rhodohalobacter sp.]MDZ7755864.1 M28 family peptidase [Rhodohalobacter sp.]